ncbi:tRNA pseudouridine38-40 synthase [Catalinimonas alkaloidigena]|uniref:tRNA pseudouridine synthase A n=1 Tax=Catalinimonas alkaloidigena TaxID=1075417 RepID=A0A1G9LC79_9BACT|nr:tRNA pseudouridine(38-40) synthase TruA [Catalinimonas alkaloidigena]SDL59568.1 tRNA pseudouridine38-40 synthase [Catalinimonas alkaloidigena]
MRYFLELAYQGTAYHGWQTQPNAHTVQAELEQALSTLLRRDTAVVASGRTDTGVHACQQFVHFDSDHPLSDRLLRSLNGILPSDVAVRHLYRVPDEAHARFDALERAYEYHLMPHKDPFAPHLSLHFSAPLDVAKMNQAAALLLSHEDFECFSRVKTDVTHFRCTVTAAHWDTEQEKLVFHISANRFLRGMVRAIVGTLLAVGTGKQEVADIQHILQSKDRRQAGHAAPPEGLFLTRVSYPTGLLTLIA